MLSEKPVETAVNTVDCFVGALKKFPEFLGGHGEALHGEVFTEVGNWLYLLSHLLSTR